MRLSLTLAALLLPGSLQAAPLLRAGDYLDTAYITALEKTFSPTAAALPDARAHMPQLVTLQPQGRALRVALTYNWHTGVLLAVLQRNGMLGRELAWGPGPDIALRLTDKNAFCLTPSAGPEHCYRRVGDAARFISTTVVAGRYTDAQGAAYSFNADGTAHFPTLDTKYALLLDQPNSQADIIAFGPGAHRMGFRRGSDSLALYGVGADNLPDLNQKLAVLRRAHRTAIVASN
jgi:hypothetical protein